MEEIKVGEYVRNNEGYIGKIGKIFYDEQEKQNYYSCEKHNVMASGYNEQIVKHSFNLIDLIEEGDYVNGNIVYEILDDEIELLSGKIRKKRIHFITGHLIDEDGIKSIVTKEQFKSVEYVIEEE